MASVGMKRSLWAVAAVALLAGCGHTREQESRDETRCAESRNLHCLTAVECSLDRDRGCEVCQCSQGPTATQEDERLPSGVPPDRRLPGP